MKLLIRYIRKVAKNDVIDQATVVGNKVKIGRGTDQNILLPDQRVALGHAKLTFTDEHIQLSCANGKYVLFNNKMVKKVNLSVGDSFDIQGHVITLAAGDGEHNFILHVNINSQEQAALKDRYHIRLQDLNLGKRRWSWFLFLTVFILTFLIPLTGVYQPDWMKTLRTSYLPDDSQWTVGTLMKSHQFMGNDCNQCHVDAFVQVNNQQCQTCHNSTKHHVDVADQAVSFAAFEECTDCHKEHNPKETLATYSQAVCVTCHGDETPLLSDGKAHPLVTDFADKHPAFNVTLVAQQPVMAEQTNPDNKPAITQWLPKRVPLADKSIKEASNLKFPHQLHLDPAGILSATDKVVMECSDCHEVEKGGWQMKPVTMEKHCSSCHLLTFDAQDPSRVVPHGSPTAVVQMMREYYAFRYIYQQLVGENSAQTAVAAGDLFTVRNARRPGREQRLHQEAEKVLDADTIASLEKLTKNTVRTDALVWAESRANSAAQDIFERQACDVCHVVSKDLEQTVPWHVEPVKLTTTWMPNAKFTHTKHQSMQCADCHSAESSQESSDILMPDIDNCQQCHGGQHSQELIPNTCIDCHDFHQAKTLSFYPVDHQKLAIKPINNMTNEQPAKITKMKEEAINAQ